MMKYFLMVILSFISSLSFADNTLLDFEKFSYRDIKFTDSKSSFKENKNYLCSKLMCMGVSSDISSEQSNIDISFVDERIKSIDVSILTDTLATCSDVIHDLAKFYENQYSAIVSIDKNVNEYRDTYVVDGNINTTRGKIHVNSMCYKFKSVKGTTVMTSFEFADIIVDTIKEEFNYGK